ncbi:MAG: TonB-dependent siderophore receptor [Sphingomonadales bacterium]|nr:TonB-dependent siderophore receptor [Sphingomonadales bacterium]
MISFRPAGDSAIRFTARGAPALAASLALGLGVAPVAHAEAPRRCGEEQAPHHVVTGEKNDAAALDRIVTPILDTPQAISIVTKEDLEDRGINNLNDALRNVAGISVGAGETSFQGNNASLRGFTTRNDLFVDNIRDYGYYYRDAFDDEAIEVLKGPSSILFGRGSTGGVIHRVSKKPKGETFARGDVQVGLDDTRRIAGDINLADIAGQNSAFRLNAFYHESAVEGRDFGRSERWGVAPKIAFGLGEQTTVQLSYVHQTERNRPDYGIPWFPGRFANPGAPAAVDPSNYYGFTNDFLNTDANIVTLKLDHSFSQSLQLRSQTRYSYNKRAFRYSEAIIPAATPQGTPLDQITVSRNLFQGFSTDEFFQNQTDFKADFDTGPLRHVLIFGGELSLENPTTTYITNFNVPSTSLTDPEVIFYDSAPNSFVRLRARSRSTGFGLFAIDTIEIGERWRAIVGLRWDSFNTRFNSAGFNQAGTQTDTAVDRTDRNLSYRGALVYKPSENGSIYAGYANSFNPSGEGIESLISAGRSVAQANINLDPETSFSVELGTKWNLFGDRVLLSASIFRIEKDQVRVPDPAFPGFNTLGGKQRVDGAEIEFNGEILPGWSVRGSYAFLDSQTLESSPAGPIVGQPLLLTARHMGTFATSYDVTDRLNVGANFISTGRRLGQNTPGSFLIAPAFTIVDLSAKFQIADGVIARLVVNNLFDAVYFEQLHPVHVIPGARRTALASLQWSF